MRYNSILLTVPFTRSTTKSAISNGTIEVRDADFNMQTLSRNTKDSLNKLDEIFDKKKIEERQELSKLFAKEAFGQLHNWNPTSKEGKAAKAIAHGVVAGVSSRIAGNKLGSGFYTGATNEALIGEIQKIAKEKPDVAQSLSALLGAAVNGSLGYSPVTGAAEAQYGTKWNNYKTRPTHEGAIIRTSAGWFIVENGEDVAIGWPGAGIIFWEQNPIPGEQSYGWDYRLNEDNSKTYIEGEVKNYGYNGMTLSESRALNLSQNAFSSALDWKSSKVTDGKVGYIGTVGNTISMMARDADNSKFSMRDQATREYLNIGYAVGTYLSLKRVPAPVSAGVNTIADERFEEFKDREVPPKTKEQIEKDNEKYVREKIEEGWTRYLWLE